jgi:adenylate kinase family enzyme
MHIYALIGPSGTGKSHHAVFIAQEYNVQMIIDDGLLIEGSRILAGQSAKRAPTKIGAIKTALFTEECHISDVKSKIQSNQPSSILILGTSLGMAERIASRLELPAPQTVINIEDVVPAKNIRKAQRLREKYGTHVIPVPTVEVKQRFSGNLVNPLRSLFKRKNQDNYPVPNRHLWVEQTTVRPTFNYLGKFYIANDVIVEIVKHTCIALPGIDRVFHTRVENAEQGIILHVDLSLVYGFYLPQVMVETQGRIKKHIEYMTSLNVISVDIHAIKLVLEGQKSKVEANL